MCSAAIFGAFFSISIALAPYVSVLSSLARAHISHSAHSQHTPLVVSLSIGRFFFSMCSSTSVFFCLLFSRGEFIFSIVFPRQRPHTSSAVRICNHYTALICLPFPLVVHCRPPCTNSREEPASPTATPLLVHHYPPPHTADQQILSARTVPPKPLTNSMAAAPVER